MFVLRRGHKTFVHMHDPLEEEGRRTRRKVLCRKRNKGDLDDGLSNLRYSVESQPELTIIRAPCSVVNTSLECDPVASWDRSTTNNNPGIDLGLF